MFAPRYFADRYFPARYFPHGDAAAPGAVELEVVIRSISTLSFDLTVQWSLNTTITSVSTIQAALSGLLPPVAPAGSVDADIIVFADINSTIYAFADEIINVSDRTEELVIPSSYKRLH